MKTLRVALVAALVAGCHFDKLFNSAPGGSHAPPPGSSSPGLAFTVPQTDAMRDSTIQPPVQVTVFDSAGNVMTSFTGDVTLALGKDPSVPKARLSGRSQAAASAGVATFPDLSIDQIGDGYTLVATIGGGEVSQESTPFNITAVPSPGPGSARTLSFTQQPHTTAAGTAIPPVQVAALDSAGHRVTTFTGPITVSLGANPGGDPLAPQTVNAVNGLATFSNLEHRRRRQRLHAARRVRGGRSRGREPVLQHHGPVMRSSELDARRELAREFRIEGLLQRPPGPIVYLARDAEARSLALKVVPRADLGPAEDRFHAAADAAAQLADPHIVPVYRHGATENFVWCATKHVDGRSLATLLQTSGPLELSACLRIFEQVASALDYAHRRGVAHGALTPGSIIVDANERALVDDFAMGGLLDIAPDGGAGDPAAEAGEDQRALAAIAYECLTGTPLGDNLPAGEDGLPGLPLHVAQALRRAVSSRQADRFPSVVDFVAALGGPRPDARTAWSGAKPLKKEPGTPVVLVDADWDPPPKPLHGRLP